MEISQNVKQIEALKPGVKDYTVSFTGIRNLALKVTPAGKKVWTWRGRVNGKSVKHTLGPYPAYGLADAKEWAAGHDIAQGQGRDLRAEETAAAEAAIKRATETVDWLFDLYMKEDGFRLRTAKARRGDYNRDIKPHIGSRSIHDITFDDLDEIVHNKKLTAPTQANHLVTLLKTMFGWGRSSHGRRLTGLAANPAIELVKPTKLKPRDRFFNQYEIGLLLRALANPKPQYAAYADGLWLILHTGVRRSEAFCAPFSEFDFAKGDWTIPGDRTKNAEKLVLPLPPVVIERLKSVKRVEGQKLIWHTKSKEGEEVALSGWSKSITALRKHVAELAKEDGRTVDHWSIHILRHTVATGMKGLLDEDDRKLIDKEIVERVSNHKQTSTPDNYDHNEYYRDKKRALRIWADHLESIRIKAQKNMDIAKAA